MGTRNRKKETLARLNCKTLDAKFLQEIQPGLNCSPFEAEAVLQVVKEVYFPYVDQETPTPPPGKITLMAVHADEPAGKPLLEHLEDFRQCLQAKGNTKQYVELTTSRARRLFAGCKFKTWSDISASKVQRYLAGLRDKNNGIGAQTSNYYLRAGRQFCKWMVDDRRANESLLAHLKGLNTRTDRRHDRRALEPDELRRLLETTRSAPERFGMTGPQRATLYRLAVESGLRAGELRSLKVKSFDLDGCSVTVEAGHSKHRRQDILPIRPRHRRGA